MANKKSRASLPGTFFRFKSILFFGRIEIPVFIGLAIRFHPTAEFGVGVVDLHAFVGDRNILQERHVQRKRILCVVLRQHIVEVLAWLRPVVSRAEKARIGLVGRHVLHQVHLLAANLVRFDENERIERRRYGGLDHVVEFECHGYFVVEDRLNVVEQEDRRMFLSRFERLPLHILRRNGACGGDFMDGIRSEVRQLNAESRLNLAAVMAGRILGFDPVYRIVQDVLVDLAAVLDHHVVHVVVAGIGPQVFEHQESVGFDIVFLVGRAVAVVGQFGDVAVDGPVLLDFEVEGRVVVAQIEVVLKADCHDFPALGIEQRDSAPFAVGIQVVGGEPAELSFVLDGDVAGVGVESHSFEPPADRNSRGELVVELFTVPVFELDPVAAGQCAARRCGADFLYERRRVGKDQNPLEFGCALRFLPGGVGVVTHGIPPGCRTVDEYQIDLRRLDDPEVRTEPVGEKFGVAFFQFAHVVAFDEHLVDVIQRTGRRHGSLGLQVVGGSVLVPVAQRKPSVGVGVFVARDGPRAFCAELRDISLLAVRDSVVLDFQFDRGERSRIIRVEPHFREAGERLDVGGEPARTVGGSAVDGLDVPFDAFACRVFGHRVLAVEFEQDGVVFIGEAVIDRQGDLLIDFEIEVVVGTRRGAIGIRLFDATCCQKSAYPQKQ